MASGSIALDGGTSTAQSVDRVRSSPRLAAAGPRDVDLAVAAARRAFDDGPWRRMPAEARARILHRFADLIEANADEIAFIDTQDCGKPYAFIRDIDLPNMADLLRYMAGWTTKLEGRTIPLSRQSPADFFSYTRRQPVGVVAQIIPWNGAALAAVWKLAPGARRGLHRGTQTRRTRLPGPAAAGRAGGRSRSARRCGQRHHRNGRRRRRTVGGSSPGRQGRLHRLGQTGKNIVVAAASNLSKLTLELGGKSPSVIYDDADLDIAVEERSAAVFYAQGEACTAGFAPVCAAQRLRRGPVPHAAASAGLKIGPSAERGVLVGPMISDQHRSKVKTFVEGALRTVRRSRRRRPAREARLTISSRPARRRRRRHDHRPGGDLRSRWCR